MLSQPTVLLICHDAEFSKAVRNAWDPRQPAPGFAVTHPDLCGGIGSDEFDVAIVGQIAEDELAPVLETLRGTSKPVIVVGNADPACVKQSCPRAVFLPSTDAEVLVVLAAEMLQRSGALARALRAEQAKSKLECHATLGKYMLDMRHTLNNALTSVLGNAELLLLEPGSLSAQARLQVETMRTMSIRIHEIFQRFTSIEKELNALEPQVSRHSRLTSGAVGDA